MEKIACIKCGAMILPATAERNKGLCASCLKNKNMPPKVLPHKSAYWAASLLLLINAVTSIYLMYATREVNQYLISAFIDVVLAVFLFKQHEVARLAAIIRSVLGLFIPVMLQTMESIPTSRLIEVEVLQVIFCGSLILFLGWQTVRWRFYLGFALGVIHLSYIGFIMVALNA